MNNSQYAAEQIVKMLIKRGWVSTDAYNVNDLIRDISTIIINASICNVQLTTTPTVTSNSGQTFTYTV
jgi:hypothetical protein